MLLGTFFLGSIGREDGYLEIIALVNKGGVYPDDKRSFPSVADTCAMSGFLLTCVHKGNRNRIRFFVRVMLTEPCWWRCGSGALCDKHATIKVQTRPPGIEFKQTILNR